MSENESNNSARSASVPSEQDFNPVGCNKAQAAWNCLGKLSRQQVLSLLFSDAKSCEEHFAFMGPTAFAYYYPIIEEYIRGVDPRDKRDHREVRALGYSIAAQLGKPIDPAIHAKITSLAEYVLQHVRSYAHNRTKQRKVVSSWKWVENRLANDPS